MKPFEIHLGCFYKHQTKGVCMVKGILSRNEIRVEFLNVGGCAILFPEDLSPIEITKKILNIVNVNYKSNGVNIVSIFHALKSRVPKSVFFQFYNEKDYSMDCYTKVKFIHELQLLFFMMCGEDISELILDYFRKKKQ